MPYTVPPLDIEPIIIGTQDLYYPELHSFCGATAAAAAAWPGVKLAIFLPIYVAVGTTINQFVWLNGTVSGNVSMAIYNEAGTAQLATTGTVAMSGASVPQAATITNGLFLPRGRYWLGFACDNTTATFRRWTNKAGALLGCRKFFCTSEQTLANLPLPATITFAQPANDYIPNMGVAVTTLAL